jgi:glycosyltransferase involved in cell wall biosynthesis
MSQTLLRLGSLARVNLIALLDAPGQIESHQELAGACESMEFIVRMTGRKVRTASLVPHSVVEFSNHDLEWLIHRQIYTREIDVLQLEYTNMGQYAAAFDRLAVLLFEHDVYFQSISRGLAAQRGLARIKAVYEYLRALRYELRLLPRVDRVQTCSRENSEYLLGFLPQLRGRLDDHLRAGIEVSRYEFRPAGRELFSMLFLGSFRHLPNLEALTWFTREVLPRVVALEPRARLVVVGSDPPPLHTLPHTGEEIEMAGFVEDIREPLARHAVFVCPILSGSGVRVKLLEAFAAGIPTVSTRLGAEGLGTEDGQYCMLADDPAGFAQRIAALLGDPAAAQAMAARAREFVTTHRNMEPMTRELELTYRRVVSRKRQA